MDEQLKKIIDLSLNYAEKNISKDTGYLHLKYHAKPGDIHYSIPVLENVLYAYSLFRTKTVENIVKGKEFLEKISYFQGKNKNFPVYLHEYPECKDDYQAVYLSIPLYWILHDFSSVIGQEFKTKLETVLLDLVHFSLDLIKNKNVPIFIKALVATSAFATGKLLNIKEMENQGLKLIEEFKTLPKDVFKPKVLGYYLLASQMWDANLKKSFLPGFFDHISNSWHPDLHTYMGVSLSEYQDELYPESTLYDLFLSVFSKKLLTIALKESPIHMYAALIRSMEENLENPLKKIHGKIEETPYLQSLNETYSYSFIQYDRSLKENVDKGFYPFKMLFGDADKWHSFVLGCGNAEKITLEEAEKTVTFFIELTDLPEFEDKEACREIIFYFDLMQNKELKVAGIKATTFELGELLEMDLDGFKIDLKFEMVDGDGSFVGHLMRGNRPSQIGNQGINRFEAYDFQVFLRTVRRSNPCTLKAILTIK